MNQFPEGLLHTYSNEGYLLQQVSLGRWREERSMGVGSNCYYLIQYRKGDREKEMD